MENLLAHIRKDLSGLRRQNRFLQSDVRFSPCVQGKPDSEAPE